MQDRKKVLLVSPLPPPYGGISHWTKLITNYSARHPSRIQLRVVDTAPRYRTVFQLSFIKRILFGLPSALEWTRFYIKGIFSAEIQAVHITTSGQYALFRDIIFLFLARLARKPTILHLRIGRTPQILQSQSLERRLLRQAFYLATKVIAIDQSTFQALLQTLPASKAQLIPNCIDLERIPRCDIDRKKNIVVFAGWVIKAKGVEDLLSAWDQAASSEWTLKIVGPYDEQYLAELQQKYRLRHVEFLGQKDNLELLEILSEAAIFCLPSHTEGFPNVILEAMATKCAIIATSVGAIPEMLSAGCGSVVEPHNPQELAQQLEKLMSFANCRKLLVENAQKKVCENYSVSVVYARYEALWKQISQNYCKPAIEP